MLPDDARLISINDHLVESPDLWRARSSRAMGDDVPRVIDRGDAGGEAWVIGSQTLPISQLSVMTSSRSNRRAERAADMYPGVLDPRARVQAMDQDGVAVHTLLPHVIGFAGERLRFLGNVRLWERCARIYNEYVIGEFCAYAPERLLAAAILPLHDFAVARRELEHAASLGARAVSLPHAPAFLGLPPYADPGWALVFAAAEEAGLPVLVHVGSSGAPPSTATMAFPGAALALSGLDVMGAAVELLFSGMLEAHPRVRVVLLEGGIAWLPYVDERIEFFRRRPEVWASTGRRLPVRILHEQVSASFIDDAVGMKLLADIGVERALWQSDFPHADSYWPNSRASLARLLAGVPDADARAIAGGNAARLLGLVSVG